MATNTPNAHEQWQLHPTFGGIGNLVAAAANALNLSSSTFQVDFKAGDSFAVRG